MSDRIDELEGLTFEEIIEENTGNSENLISEESKPEPILDLPEKQPEEEKGTPFFGNVVSPDSKTGTIIEEQIRGISKIVDKVQGKEVEEEASLIESLVGAGVSAGIKIPKGLVTFGTLLTDIFRDENLPADETLTAKFNEAFDQTTLGKIEQASEEVAAETAAGKITEAIGQLYGAGKIAQKTAIPVVEKDLKKLDN